MPKRLGTKLHQALLTAVIVRDGDACILCGVGPVHDKTLDHLNGRIRDNRLENLHLMHRGCNTAERNRIVSGRQRLLNAETVAKYRALRGFPPLLGSQVPPVCESKLPAPNRWMFSTADEVNRVLEPLYRFWLFQRVFAQGGIAKGDAIHAGAEYLQGKVGRGSSPTTERYFQKVISSLGWLTETRNPDGHPWWIFRQGRDIAALERDLSSQVKPGEDRPGTPQGLTEDREAI